MPFLELYTAKVVFNDTPAVGEKKSSGRSFPIAALPIPGVAKSSERVGHASMQVPRRKGATLHLRARGLPISCATPLISPSATLGHFLRRAQ